MDALLEQPWYHIFGGVMSLGIAAGAVFWSHFWRRQPRPFTRIVALVGHFVYFAFCWLFASLGFLQIGGGIRGIALGMTGVLDIRAVVMAVVIGGIVTVLAMTWPPRYLFRDK